jgi:hypothetical protein
MKINRGRQAGRPTMRPGQGTESPERLVATVWLLPAVTLSDNIELILPIYAWQAGWS